MFFFSAIRAHRKFRLVFYNLCYFFEVTVVVEHVNAKRMTIIYLWVCFYTKFNKQFRKRGTSKPWAPAGGAKTAFALH